jgi:hypothetical protein
VALVVRKVVPLGGARAVAGAETGPAKLGAIALIVEIERPAGQTLELSEFLLRERARVTAREFLELGKLPALQAAEHQLGRLAHR